MEFYKTAIEILNRDCKNLSPFTKRTYLFNLKKLYRLEPNLQIENIDVKFIEHYKKTMEDMGNAPSTVSKSLSVLKNFCRRLKSLDLMQRDPFSSIRIARVQGERKYLNVKELKKLYDNFLLHGDLLRIPERNAVKAFLFGCFTGLRFQDLKSLSFEEIKDFRIRKKMHKTGDYVYIPIPEQAKVLLENKKNGLCFKVADNSYFNRFLRSGANRLGLHVHLHAHLACHTFATTCLSLDIPLAITSKLLGHKDVSTTLIYAKYVDKVLDREIKKFKKL